MGYIYRIDNLLNGKFYIGKTTKSLKDRWRRHIYDCKYQKHTKSKFYNAIRKYGPENFEIYVFESVGDKDQNLINEREKYWIEVLEPDYNMTTGGTGGNTNNGIGRRWKIKDTSNMRNKKTITKKVLDGRKFLTGGNNYQSKYKIYTPWGIFETWRDAITHAKGLLENGIKNVILSASTLRTYCLENKIFPDGRRTVSEWKGRYSRDVGFYVEIK